MKTASFLSNQATTKDHQENKVHKEKSFLSKTFSHLFLSHKTMKATSSQEKTYPPTPKQ